MALLVAGMCPLLAETAGTVTEAVNDVMHGAQTSSSASPAKTGTHLKNGEYLKTGAQSRAELELANQSITRLGANTIFNYSTADNEIDLQAGTILFSKPKDGQQMNIKTASVTAAIVGTTGFVQVHGKGFVFGIVEGHATVTIGGVDYTITAGEMLKFTPGKPPVIVAFDVPKFLGTSPLFTRFHRHLPNQTYIDEEIADYNDLVKRGFIQPASEPFFPEGFDGNTPVLPFIGGDSAGQGLHDFNMPPPQQQKSCCWWEYCCRHSEP
ncbi:MAG: FecR domain-containing protein [Methylacidiphilales bacterium]|nr:FecR domain-containing protein [Candidatus Methylacidiphilales bacterium]